MVTCLVRVVGKVDFVEDLRRLVLDGFHFDLVRRILALAVAQRLLQPLQRIGGDRMAAGAQEQRQLLQANVDCRRRPARDVKQNQTKRQSTETDIFTRQSFSINQLCGPRT